MLKKANMKIDANKVIEKVKNQRNAYSDEAAMLAAALDAVQASLDASQLEVADLKAKVSALTPK